MRLWAEGARETVLIPHIEAYTDALERSWREERAYVQNLALEDHEEPELPLPDYDPRALVVPELLDEDETIRKRDCIVLLNARIRRWLKYRARRLRRQLRPKLDARNNPWAALLSKLSGFKAPPKARQAYQQFMKEAYQSHIAPVVTERWTAQSSEGSNLQTSKDPNGPFRASVARELFAALSEDERQGYSERAKEEAAEARKIYDDALKNPPSRSPEARQKCIDEVGNFLGPILQGILERTGLHGVVILGGPIPKYGGDLRTVYVSYGRNRTHSAQHMPQWAKERWDTQVVGLMKEYLQTAFSNPSPQDIAEAALPDALVGAKYTIDEEDQSVADDSAGSDSEESDSSASDSSEDSDDSDAPAKKKRKRGSKAKEPKKKTASKAPAKKAPVKKAPIQQRAPAHPSPTEPPAAPETHASDDGDTINVSRLTMAQIIEKTLTSKTVTTDTRAPLGLSYNQTREWNIARNQILLRPLRDEIREGLADIGLGGVKKKPAERKKRAGVESDAADTTPRKSQRLNPEEPQTPAADPGSATHAIPASTPTATEQTSVLPASQAPLPPAATPPPHMTPPPTQQQAHPTPLPASQPPLPPAATPGQQAPRPAPCESAAAPAAATPPAPLPASQASLSPAASPAITRDAAAHSAAGAPDPAPCESAAAPARRDSPGSALCESGVALARRDSPAITREPPPTQQPAHPTPLAVDVVIPAHAPAWLRDAVALFRTEVWGATSPRCSQRW
ncbi:hypothetical protein B0H13DRAFT_2368972 [Mycena leptocephala]|nr:hypothetical protein B0H13DRAFT_2368972 [Mycena leptocephala]